MSQINTVPINTTATRNSHRATTAVLLTAVLVLAALPATAAPSTPASCENATALRLNSALRSHDQAAVFRVQVPSTGVLTLELSRPARIDVAPCAGSADVLVAERSEKHAVLAARTDGVFFLRVTGTQRFKIANDFTPARLVVDDLELAGLPVRRTSWIAEALGTKGDPEDVYPDPDGLNTNGERRLVSFLTLEASLVHKGDPEDVYPDPDGLVVGTSSDD